MSCSISGGVWPAVLSAVERDGTPRLAAMDQLVELFVEQALGGLYLLGSTGQGPALPIETRKQLVEHVCAKVAGRLPVIVQVGAISTFDAIELAQHAAGCGVDAISAAPPIYFPVDVELTFEHYRRIAEATDLPFFPYHAGFIQLSVPPIEQYARRLIELPNFAGMKLTEANLIQFTLIRSHLGDDYLLFSGFDELACQSVLSGADGMIGTFMNLFGPAFQDVDRAVRDGDVALAGRFTQAFCRAVEPLIRDRRKFSPFFRSAMQLKYGIDIGPGRSPMHLCEDAIREEEVRRIISTVDAAAAS